MHDRPDPIARILAIEGELEHIAERRDAAWDALTPEERASLWLPGDGGSEGVTLREMVGR